MKQSHPPIRPRIGFIVDHPKRDLAGGVMLAHAFARLGVETALVPLYDQAIDVPLLGLSALIVNFARPSNLDLVRAYRTAGIPVFVLDTEGGVLAEDGANSPARLAAYIRDSGFSDVLSGYFFWGGTLHDAFVRGSGIPAERLHLTGCPRFDLAAPAWRDMLAFDSDGYVLFNANFSLVNPLFAGSIEKERATALAAGWDGDYLDGIIADSRRILDGFVETVAQAARSLPERRFRLRPHPFENDERYRRAFADLPNVTVDGQGSVLNVIHHADCVVHLGCGTSIEALRLGKLPLSLEFLSTPRMHQHMLLPSQVSLSMTSQEHLLRTLGDLASARSEFDFASRHERLVQPWFHLNDGQAGTRVAAAVVAALGSAGPVVPSVLRSLRASRLQPRPSQRVHAVAANIVGSRAASRIRAMVQPLRKSKQFDAVSVQDLADRIAAQSRTPALNAHFARHPVTGVTLASVVVAPRDKAVV